MTGGNVEIPRHGFVIYFGKYMYLLKNCIKLTDIPLIVIHYCKSGNFRAINFSRPA